jgi:hypothetical protein
MKTRKAMKKLRQVNLDAVHAMTLLVRWNNWMTASYSTLQCWKWHGGDAVVVWSPYHFSTVVIRRGKRVDVVVACSLNEAMLKVGLDPTTFTVTA